MLTYPDSRGDHFPSWTHEKLAKKRAKRRAQNKDNKDDNSDKEACEGYLVRVADKYSAPGIEQVTLMDAMNEAELEEQKKYMGRPARESDSECEAEMLARARYEKECRVAEFMGKRNM